MSVDSVATTAAGEPVHALTIAGGGLTARLMTWGSVLMDLRLEGHPNPLVLGFPDFASYPDHSRYFGANVGRYANRINHGRFPLDGRTVQVDTNFLGRHHLHGGAGGFGKRNWTLADHGADYAIFTLRAPDGEMGFPGNLDVTCTYRLKEGGAMGVTFDATTDAPTLCNLAHHSYFSLGGGGTTPILDHVMQIAAPHYLPVDDEAIPTGEIAPVAGTPFDFLTGRPIRLIQGATPLGYDHNFCLSDARTELRPVAHVSCEASGVTMDVETTEAGLQFYAGGKLDVPVPGLDGIRYGAFAGLCLEAQAWPDSPNHPDWPGAILRPGETYRTETIYRFSKQ